MGQRVSVREFGRLRGCTHGAVQKAISDGRIPASAVERDARGRIKSIDFAVATLAWNANTDTDQAARTAGGAASVVGAEQLALGDPDVQARAPDAKAGNKQVEGLRAASAEGKRLQNQLLELELSKELGLVVSIEDLREVSHRRYRAIREKVLTVPDRVADLLAAERDAAQVHAILIKELERTLNELANDAAASALAPGEVAESVAA